MNATFVPLVPAIITDPHMLRVAHLNAHENGGRVGFDPKSVQVGPLKKDPAAPAARPSR